MYKILIMIFGYTVYVDRLNEPTNTKQACKKNSEKSFFLVNFLHFFKL